MQLRILGCSGSISRGLHTTSLLVDDDVLIDAGTGVGELTLDEMMKIEHVFLTHSHLDHIATLPFLVDVLFNRETEPLSVHASHETIDAIKRNIFNWEIWPDFAELPSKQAPVIKFFPMERNSVVEIKKRHFEMIPVNHVVPGVAYHVSNCTGGSFCFSGDTTTNDSLWETLNKKDSLDMLVIEVGFPNQHMALSKLAKHYCPQLLREDLLKLKHRPKIGISHLKPGSEDESFQQCIESIPNFDLLRLRGGDTFTL
ncbi:MAG: 3',5'-cyclic-nucleotide phosphodiesterase [Pseudomonadota bacterium]